jgi:uncharacterized membrane protein YGL010W
MAARSIQQWFDAYGESHRNPTNKLIHWICVPTIYFCLVALLWSIPGWPSTPWLPSGWAAMSALLLVALFYVRLSIPIMFGMALFSGLCLLLSAWLDTHADRPLWSIALVLFVAAWIGQFYGHKVEGKKPSFLDDLQFLMIGPAWLMGFIYRRLGISY